MFMFLVKSSALFIGSIALIRLYLNRTWKKCESKRRLDGQTAVITGANCGIGKQTARLLLQNGAKVILACRNTDAAITAIDDLNRNRTDDFGCAVFKHLDLNSFQSVKRFADDIIRTESKLNILINNAAVYKCPFAVNEDGFETHFSTNHFSHALLTTLLLPKLAESGTDESPSRVVFVTSTLYKYGQIRDVDLEPNKVDIENYEINKAYSNSKLAALLYFRKAAKQLEEKKIPVKMFAASPGVVFTNIGRHMQLFWKILVIPLAFCFLRTPRQGAQTTMHCVLEASENGAFYRNCERVPFAGKANDESLMTKVYDRTMNAIKAYCNV